MKDHATEADLTQFVKRTLADALSKDGAGREPGHAFARYVRAAIVARKSGGGLDTAIKALEGWGDKDLAAHWKTARAKALAAGDATAGGFLIPTEASADIIELLRPMAVVRSLKPMILPMASGSIKISKIVTGATATYTGENRNAQKSQEEFGQITLSFKKLTALVPVSNDLLRYSSPSADTVVRDDVVRAMAAREDLAFIRGDGSDTTPKGILNWTNAANKFNANATVNVDNVTSDLGGAMQKLMDAEIPLMEARCGWMFAPRTWRYLTTVRLTNGPYAFRDEMVQRQTLLGFPFRVTTQIPITDGVAGTGTKIYFVGFADAVIGEALSLQVDASHEAAYHDGANLVSAYSQDQTVVRVIAEHDFALRRDKAAAIIEGATWGV